MSYDTIVSRSTLDIIKNIHFRFSSFPFVSRYHAFQSFGFRPEKIISLLTHTVTSVQPLSDKPFILYADFLAPFPLFMIRIYGHIARTFRYCIEPSFLLR